LGVGATIGRSFLFVACAVVFGAAWLVRLAAGPVEPQERRTTRDGVYTAAQAARGKEAFTKTCARCHILDPSLPKLEGPPLAGQSFFNTWEEKSVFDLATSIRLGMPPDGSVVIDAAMAADLIAFILESNKLPPGSSELVADASARAIKIAGPSAAPEPRR
jgi:quinoprotein glucose dehydrogenase